MANWKVGEVVKCINVKPLQDQNGNCPPLRLNAEYIIQAVRTCECGNISLDVGLSINGDSRGIRCACGAISSPKTGIWWCSHKRFAKRQADTAEESLDEMLEELGITTN